MFKTIISIYFLLSFYNSNAQEPFLNYKKAADLILKQRLGDAISKLVKCKSFYVEMSDSTSGSYPSFEASKYESEPVKTITFTYSFFSKSIKSVFNFDITINSNKQFIDSESTISSIPLCVVKESGCEFISKDSAMRIAIKDSILYQNNLRSTFEMAPKSEEFYWVVEGEPKAKPSANIKRMTSNYGVGSDAMRYIDAKTGKIVSRGFFLRKIMMY